MTEQCALLEHIILKFIFSNSELSRTKFVGGKKNLAD